MQYRSLRALLITIDCVVVTSINRREFFFKFSFKLDLAISTTLKHRHPGEYEGREISEGDKTVRIRGL